MESGTAPVPVIEAMTKEPAAPAANPSGKERERAKIAAAPAAVIKPPPKQRAAPPGSLLPQRYGSSSYTQGYALRQRLQWSTRYPKRAGPPAEDAYSLQHALVARYQLSDDPSKTLDLHPVVVQSPLLNQAWVKCCKTTRASQRSSSA